MARFFIAFAIGLCYNTLQEVILDGKIWHAQLV